MMMPEEMAALRQRVKEKTDANGAALRDMAGRGIQVPPEVMTQMRILFFIEHSLGGRDTERALVFEEALQDHYQKAIAETKAQANRAILMQGLNNGHPLLGGK